MTDNEILFRAVEPRDADLFYEIENDSDSWSDSDTIAPFSRHLLRQYAETYRADPVGEGQLRLIAVSRKNGRPIGILDFYGLSFIHRHGFIGIFVLPEFRNHGFGGKILGKGKEYASARLNLEILGAKILASNESSKRLFMRCGFKKCGTLPGWRITRTGRTPLEIYVAEL